MELLNKSEMGKRIRQIRKNAALRQWQLAQILGTTQSAVHKYEHGVIPEPRRLVRLAQIGNTTIEWILTGRHWENGSEAQERPAQAIFGLAERLRSIGPEERSRIDEALRILGSAIEVLGNGSSELAAEAGLGSPEALAASLTTQRRILEAARRIQTSIVGEVLDLERERLEKPEGSGDGPGPV